MMEKFLIKFGVVLAVMLLIAMLISSGGCSVPGQKPASKVILQGASVPVLGAYDVCAMSANTIWGFGTFGWGFNKGNTLAPVYNFRTKQFEAQEF